MSDHGEISVPGGNTNEGESTMADPENNDPEGDLSNDCLELLLDQQYETFDHLQSETVGNISGAASIVRYSGARKFNQEDPIEAAATEMILRKD